MPPLKRLKQNSDPPISMPRVPVYLTDDHVEQLGLDGDQDAMLQTISDAQDVYAFINPNPWEVTQDKLAEYAEAQWGDQGPTRLSAALKVLESSGRIVTV